jgi:anaerobic selenocysteine-containing dehydrogenase
VGEARSEWEILTEVGRRSLKGAARSAIDFKDCEQIREEMDRMMPLYRGIVQLRSEGQSFQYGGERLLEGGVCPAMPDGRARFSVLAPAPGESRDGQFVLTTRRGTQFNSILFRDMDALTGARRDDVIVSAADATRLDLREGDGVVVKSGLGEMTARVRIGPARPGTVQAHWPEANKLIARHYEASSGEPDYNALVSIRKITS